MSKLIQATEALSDKWLVSWLKKSGNYLLSNTEFGSEVGLKISKRQIRKRIQNESDLDDILDTVLEVNPGITPFQVSALQLRDELRWLAEFVQEEEPQTILEIGTASGGTLYTWCRYLNSVDTVISLDLKGGRFGGGYHESQVELFREFGSDIDMRFIRADSHATQTFNRVKRIIKESLDNACVDFLFIDGDHTYEGVKQDFGMYSKLVCDGGIVAFHDIVHHPSDPEEVEKRRGASDGIEDRHLKWGEGFGDCNVDQLWDEISAKYPSQQFISHRYQTWGGIGIIRYI